MKYAMIDKFRHQHPVSRLCALVDVAKSGYQTWCTGKVTSPRKLEDLHLVVAIKAGHQRGRGIYGVARALHSQAWGCVAGAPSRNLA